MEADDSNGQSGAAPLSIAIQDRRRLFREGLELILGAEPDLSVVAPASTAQDLVAATEGCDVDIVLLELDAPEWDPCRLAVALSKRHPGLTVIGTVAAADTRPSSRAYRAGVRTVFFRDAGMRTLLQTIRSLPGPGRAPEAHRVIDVVRDKAPVLSHREVEVLTGISSGCTTQRVAAALGISPKTVENHKQRIFVKLGVQNQAHAVAVASRRGLLPTTFARVPSAASSTFPQLSA